MKYACQVTQRPDHVWTARHISDELGRIEVTASSRDEALEKIRGELRYRLELCPCSGETYQHIHIELVDA